MSQVQMQGKHYGFGLKFDVGYELEFELVGECECKYWGKHNCENQ